MSKKVYIIHGREWSPDVGRLYRLRKELDQLDIQAVGLSMPHPDVPTVDDWVQTLQDQIIPDSDTYIVAHSVGVQTALRWLQILPEEASIGGLVSVAGWFHLHGLEDEESKLQARPWLETVLDTEKVKKHCWKVIALFSDNDPWVPLSDSEEFVKRLNAQVIIEHDMDHIHWLDPQRGYPLLKDIVLELMWYNLNELKSAEGEIRHNDWEVSSEKKEEQSPVMIRVLDRDGSVLGSFAASQHESILDTAEKNNIDIGYSCRSGACFACACHVQQWQEYIDIGKFGYPLVDVEEEDCLTCIGWIMDDARSGSPKEIIIKKF